MLHPRTICLLPLVATLLAFGPASAQNIPSPYRFVEHSQEGGIFFGTASIRPGQLRLGPKSADVIGGRYSLTFGGALAFEAGATMFKGERDVIDIRRSEGEQVLGQSSIDLIAIEARFRLHLTGQRTWRGLQPFLATGGGMALSSNLDRTLEDEADMLATDRFDFGSKFIATLGAGTNIHLSPRLMLRLDGVLNLWKITTPPGWLTTDAELGTIPEDEWVSARHISLGASWRF